MSVFYEKKIREGRRTLSEEEIHHCVTVLRYREGDKIKILDGKGGEFEAEVTSIKKKSFEFKILSERFFERKEFKIHLGIAPTKNMDRIGWMIEKLGEMGVDEVTFLRTKNSERLHLRCDRLEKKTISAMKQSGNKFLTKLNDLIGLNKFIHQTSTREKWIAHLGSDSKYLGDVVTPQKDVVILIGPEGDFDRSEVEMAHNAGFQSVSLGQTILRTETAGLLACHFINAMNRF